MRLGGQTDRDWGLMHPDQDAPLLIVRGMP